MKLYEYMAKDIFKQHGIPVPAGQVFTASAPVASFVRETGPVAIKSQILSGGRGKAGGIKFADTPEDAVQKAEELLTSDLKGLKVDTILVEEKLPIEQELYLALTVDTVRKGPLLLASSAGGVEIETVAEADLLKIPIDISLGLSPAAAQYIVAALGLKGEVARQALALLPKLYTIFRTYDAELVEINPLVIADGRLVAADGKIILDDEASFRYPHDVPRVDETAPRERQARQLGISYVELDGNIGVMANGAGITMATLDLIRHYGAQPCNFMDAGGGASKEATAAALEILLSAQPDALLINIFGGITRCDDVANAFVQVKESMDIPIPVVIRLAGTNDEKGRAILEAHGLICYQDIEPAVAKVVELAGKRTGED